MNYSESRAWENSEQCREAKLTRAIERRRNTRQIDPEHCRIRASRWCAWKVTWYNLVINERNQTWLCMFWWITNSKHSGECGYFLHPSKRLVQFSLHNFCCKFLPGRFTQAEVNCQLAVSDFCCGVNLPRKLSQFSIINYRRGEISLFSIGILFKVFLTWSHAMRRFIIYIVLISLSFYQ